MSASHSDTDLPSPPRSRAFRRLLSEPLVHFLIAGILVFGAYRIITPPSEQSSDSQTVELTGDDLRQLALTWLAQGRPLPSTDEMRSLIDQKVTEEILVREAVSLGLDQDDQIIKRRLAQKMDFLAADLAAMQEPTDAELAAWYSSNSKRFALPPHVSFRHLYFSPDKRADNARKDSEAALASLAGKPGDTPDASALADPFMLRNYYGDSTPEQMAKEFGPEFASALFGLTPGSWQGPIQSGYGWHLVWIDSLEPGRVPAFDEVKPDVKAAWLDERYREVKANALKEMRSRYKVVVPPLDSVDLQNLGSPQSDGMAVDTVSQ